MIKSVLSKIYSSTVVVVFLIVASSCAQPGSNDHPAVSVRNKAFKITAPGSAAGTADPMAKLSSGTVSFSLSPDPIAKTVVWNEKDGGMTVEKVDDSNACWKVTGTGSWMGMGIKVNTPAGIADMSGYEMGTLRFKYKGKRGAFLVGVRSVGQPDDRIIWAWIDVTNSPQPDQWYKVVIPIKEFMRQPSALNLKKIDHFFMMASVKDNGYRQGDSYLIEDISWSKKTSLED